MFELKWKTQSPKGHLEAGNSFEAPKGKSEYQTSHKFHVKFSRLYGIQVFLQFFRQNVWEKFDFIMNQMENTTWSTY